MRYRSVGATAVVALVALSVMASSAGAAPSRIPLHESTVAVTEDPSVIETLGATIVEIPSGVSDVDGAPVEIVVDTNSGEILQVSTRQSNVTTFSDIGITNNDCSNNRPCWRASPPGTTFGVVGTGTKTGNWPLRLSFNSSNREAMICWQGNSNVFCSDRMNHNTVWRFNTPATGLAVTLY